MLALVVLYTKHLSDNSRKETDMSIENREYEESRNNNHKAAIFAYSSMCILFVTLTAIFICISSAGAAAVSASTASASFFATLKVMQSQTENNLKDYIRNNTNSKK